MILSYCEKKSVPCGTMVHSMKTLNKVRKKFCEIKKKIEFVFAKINFAVPKKLVLKKFSLF